MLKQLIIMEGLSHSGKTTVINELKNKFDHKVLVLNTPNSKDLEEIEEYFISKIDALDPEKDAYIINNMKVSLEVLQQAKKSVANSFDRLRNGVKKNNFSKQMTAEDYINLNKDGVDAPYLALVMEVASIVSSKTTQLKALVDMVNFFDQDVTIIVDRFIGSSFAYGPVDIIDMVKNPKKYQFRLDRSHERDVLITALSRLHSTHDFLNWVALTQAPVLSFFLECPLEERKRRSGNVTPNDESDKEFDKTSLEFDTIMRNKYHHYMVKFSEDCSYFNPDIYDYFVLPTVSVEQTVDNIIDILNNKEQYKVTDLQSYEKLQKEYR